MKKLCMAVGFGLLLASTECALAQDLDKVFEEFDREQKASFEAFRNKADAQFLEFLKDTWQKYEAFEPVAAPVRPEPPKPVLFDRSQPIPEPVKLTPQPIRKPEQPSQPEVPPTPPKPVQLPAPDPSETAQRIPVLFYGTSIPLDVKAVRELKLHGSSEAQVAEAWKAVCSQPYEQLLVDCMEAKEKYQLNDWAYLLLTKQLGVQLYGEQELDKISFLQMFVMAKSGYKIRLAKIDDHLKLMVATAETVYGVPYLRMDGDKYYVFQPNPNGSTSLYTYKGNFADAKQLVSLQLSAVPRFEMKTSARQFKAKDLTQVVEAEVNTHLMAFYADYPQCSVAIHYHTPMSPKLRERLYAQLRTLIQGKSETEAANLLIHFVQTAFDYQTDGEQFGYEKPFFTDELFYYPACDCEDRAMLFSALVRDLLGLPVVLLDYPEHIAAAVKFPGSVRGDMVVLPNGDEYLICDPTYIGAPIGRCMERFKKVSPEIIE